VKRAKQAFDDGDTPDIADILIIIQCCERADGKLREAIDLLAQSRHAFRSKQIERRERRQRSAFRPQAL